MPEQLDLTPRSRTRYVHSSWIGRGSVQDGASPWVRRRSLAANQESPPVRPVSEEFDYGIHRSPAPMIPLRSTSWMKQ